MISYLSPPASTKRYGMNEKILIIDPEPHIRQSLKAILTKKGYQVRSASDGNEAISVFRSESFALVITELRVPKLDGLKLIRRFKEVDEDVEIVVLTGYATIDNAVQAFRHDGAFDFLLKPLENVDQLFISVKQALQKHRLCKDNKTFMEGLKQANEELKCRVEKAY